MATESPDKAAALGNPCRAILHYDGALSLPPRRCKKTDDVKPMAYRGEPWCSENHRKLVVAQRAEGRW